MAKVPIITRYNIAGLGRPSCKEDTGGLGRPIMCYTVKYTGNRCSANSHIGILKLGINKNYVLNAFS